MIRPTAIAAAIKAALGSDDAPVDHWVTIDGEHVPITSGGGGGGGGEGGGGKSGGSSKEDPIANVWRQQAKKMSTPKLKKAIQNYAKFNGTDPKNETAKMAMDIIKKELESRGVKVNKGD